jgi:hypothetical protein
MIFSRRKDQPRDCGPAIADFWQWWHGVRAQLEKAIEGAGWDDTLVRLITKKVKAIHPGLVWKHSKGTTSKHILVVCANGDRTLRAIAERWLAAAPPPDPTWAYHASRQADPDVFRAGTLTIAGHTVVLQKMRFGIEVDPDRYEIDVTAFHPIFSVMTEEEQLQVTFLTLDRALGESGVELWVGRVEASRTEPQRPHTVIQLRSAVTNLAQKVAEDSWAMLTGEDQQGYTRTAMAQVPLKPARWPRFDTHVRVDLPYRNRRDNGFPHDESLEALRVFEDRLATAVGPDGQVVAHETARGRRTLHLYIDGLTRAADVAKRLLPQWREAKATMATSFDPAWDAISHLRG